jgi:hypothetical protein
VTTSPRFTTLSLHFVLALIILLSAPRTALAVATDDFKVESTGDLVALCSVEEGSDNAVAAIHFCHGFASGAFRYYQSMADASPSAKYVCTPSPAPTRNQVIADYVGWARANPQVMSDPAVDSLFRYLGTKYPCKT